MTYTFGYLLVLKSVHCNMCALWDLSGTVSQYFYRRRNLRKKSHDQIYWSHHHMAPVMRVTSQNVTALHPNLLFTSSPLPPPPPPPSPLPHDGITPHLPTIMRYSFNLLSSNQLFFPMLATQYTHKESSYAYLTWILISLHCMSLT